MKSVFAIGDSSRMVRVMLDRETEEYVARLYIDLKHYEPADYFTDDKSDAISTARTMLQG